MNPYKYIQKFKKYGKKGGFKPGLSRVKKLLSYFDNPQDKVDYIHIGGSNGKGSTAAILSSIYKEAGYRVGTYISPPLIHFNERFRINKKPISTEELSGIIDSLKKIFDDPEKNIDIDEPSFFEIITVIAFIYFAQKDIDIGILEVGLGGRLDATNVIKKPLISVITNISCEHADILGPNIEDIAYEKSGIIKKDRPIITGELKPEALKVLQKRAFKKNSKFIVVNNKNNLKISKKNMKYQLFDLEYKSEVLQDLKLKILGDHQFKNTFLALKAVELLTEKYDIKKEVIYRGLRKCRWPGRLEVMGRDPYIILDGAHNVAGMEMLVEFLKKNKETGQKIIFLISILKDKDYKEMINLIYKLSNVEFIITANQNERSLKPELIQKYVADLGLKSNIHHNIYSAVKKLKKIAAAEDLVCITGSLYTVAEARFYVKLLIEGGL